MPHIPEGTFVVDAETGDIATVGSGGWDVDSVEPAYDSSEVVLFYHDGVEYTVFADKVEED